MLAGSIRKAVRTYISNNQKAEWLIIHFYKSMINNELRPILKELNELGLNTPVIIISINKTESKDFVLFDLDCLELITPSGTFIYFAKDKFLLCNNTRYGSTISSPTDGYPFPIKLNITLTDKEILKDQNLVNNLIDHVHQFSSMYWKSVRQQNFPVTIKYPEMVTEIFPYFESDIIPQFGRQNLWFL